MIRKTPVLTLLSAILLGSIVPPGTPAWAQDARGAREAMASAMADAMVRMMEAMGLFGGGSFGRWGGVPALSGLMQPYGSLMGVPGGSWGGAMADPSRAYGLGSDALRQMYQGASGDGGWGGDGLNGVWEGSGGDLLIVQGGRYRLYAPQDQYIEGLLQQQASRVALYNMQDGRTQIFDFATQDGRLALRAANGQVYLYRRFTGLPIAGGATTAPDQSAPPATAPEPAAPPAAPPSAPKTSSAR